MTISYKQKATSENVNNAFASKTANNELTGVQTLNNPSSGSQVANVQQAINDLIDEVNQVNQDLVDGLALYVPLTQRGAADGVATLDSSGKVPAAQLPSYVDDVLEYADFASLPVSGSTGVIYVTTSDNKSYRWSGSTYVQISSAGGSGGTNFLSNPDAESSTTGWNLYTDAASSSPVDGTGGAGTGLTFTRSTTTPGLGNASFLFAKDAANRQGAGVSTDFTISPIHKAKVLQVEFEYMVNSGTFSAGSTTTDSDVKAFLYDVTNARLIPLSSERLSSANSSLYSRFVANFQSAYNSTSYRLILHVATTSASAWELKIDDLIVTPSKYVYGTPITDWQSFPSVAAGTLITSTGSAPTFGTVSVNTARWRRVGGDAEVEWNFAQTSAGTLGSGAYLFNIPAALGTLDTSFYTFNTNVAASSVTLSAPNVVGDFNAFYEAGVGGKSIGNGAVIPYSASQLKVYMEYANEGAGGDSDWWGTFYGMNLTPMSCSLRARFKVAGWSATTQMSDSAETRVISCTVSSSTTSIANGSDDTIIFTNVEGDSTGSYDPATGLYRVSVPGDYEVGGKFSFGSSFSMSVGGTIRGGVKLNGSVVKLIYDHVMEATLNTTHSSQYGSVILKNLKVGDLIGTTAFQNSGSARALAADTTRTYMSIKRLAGPTAISATENITSKYTSGSAQQNIPNNTTTVLSVFGTKEWDSHGCYNPATGYFTANAPGEFEVNAGVQYGTNGTGIRLLYAVSSAGKQQLLDYKSGSASIPIQLEGTTRFMLKQGETINLNGYQNSGATLATANDAAGGWISVRRVGNYVA